MLEVGTGFHQELTGRENVYLSGAILGMRRGEIQRKFDEIVAFAEIEESPHEELLARGGICGIASSLGAVHRAAPGACRRPCFTGGLDFEGTHVYGPARDRGPAGAIIDTQPEATTDRKRGRHGRRRQNGEIYNYRELMHELELCNWFRSRCDTEVLVHGHEQWGPSSGSGPRGMFGGGRRDAR